MSGEMFAGKTVDAILESIQGGYRNPQDEFFNEGNKLIQCAQRKLGVMPDSDSECEEENNCQLDKAGNAGSPVKNEIFCNVPGCQLLFRGVSAYQTHFNSVHKYICSECRRSLPTDHLLDLHISEKHDSYFAARAARGEAMYSCYLPECKVKMHTPENRKDHCISAHKFPTNFRFDEYIGKVASTSTKPKTKDAQKTGSDTTEGGYPLKGQYKNEHTRKIKTYTFGHQNERTFQPKRSTTLVHKKTSEETFNDMQEMKEALDEVM